MIPYREEKIQNAVAFFADQFRKKARKPLPQTGLYKLLAYLDFTSLKETGRPVLGLIYKAMDMGPVPMEIYGTKKDTEKYKFQATMFGQREGLAVIPKGIPDLDYFSNYEFELMKRIIEIFARSWITTSIMSDSSHQQILAWKRSYKKQKNSIIDYSLEFDGDLFSKKLEELTFPEESYLTFRALSE